jgi:hypothetical protein
VSHEDYLVKKSLAGKRKLRGTALLAYGDDESRFEAAVLFHEAARLEQEAVGLSGAMTPEERLGATVERCGCLIDGLAPTEAVAAWKEVEDLTRDVPADVAAALRRRLDPEYEAMTRALDEARRGAPVLTAAELRWRAVPAEKKPEARAELAELRRSFPGEAGFHLIEFAAALEQGRLDEAGRAALRAYRLRPEEPNLRCLMLMTAGEALPPDQLEALLERTHEDLKRAPADGLVYFGFALASLDAASAGAGELHRRRALWAAETGTAQPSSVQSEGARAALSVLAVFVRLLVETPDVLVSLFDVVLESAGIRLPEPATMPSRGMVIKTIRSRVANLLVSGPEPLLAA